MFTKCAVTRRAKFKTRLFTVYMELSLSSPFHQNFKMKISR